MPAVTDEVFARFLIQIGGATPEQIKAAQDAQAVAAKSGQRVALADVLIQRGIITPAIKENVEKKATGQQPAIQKLKQYRLIRKLGEGGMGVVYLAEDTDLQRKVAIKVLPKRFVSDAQSLTRFKREAHAAGKLNHDNIVGAYDAGEDAGHHFYVMEYCEGEPLNVILKRQKSLALDKALDIVTQIAQGLKHAHDQGLIHRDIKPANVFITGAGVAKILDLGLTKELNDSENSFATQTGVALGTPHYISPEQAQGKQDIDGRTDIYSLGATYYHLITGQTPFFGATSALIMSKHINEQLPNPQDIREDAPDSVAHIIANMMAKNREDRYRNCGELLEDLERVRKGEEPSSQALDAQKTSIAARARTARKPGAGPQSDGSRRKRTGEPREIAPSAGDNKQTLYIAAGATVLVVGVVIALMSQGQNHPQVTLKPDVVDNKKRDEEVAQRLDEERHRARLDEDRLKAEQVRLDEDRRKLDEEKRKIEDERKRTEAAQAAAQRQPTPPLATTTVPTPLAPADVVVAKTEPTAPNKPQEPAPAVATPKKVDEQKRIVAAPAISNSQKVEDAMSECFALLAKGQTPAATASAKKDSSTDAQALVRVLERGQLLRNQAIENLIKKPPIEPVQITTGKMKLTGVITRVDAKQAYVKAEGVELPVSLSQLPNAVLFHALELNEAKPEGLADKATYLFSAGDLEQAKPLIPPLDKQTYADLHTCLDIMGKIERQKQFETALSEAEKAIGSMDATAAISLVEKLTQKFATLSDTQKERVEKLSARAQGKRAAALLRQAFSGEVLSADDNYNVEVRYNYKKGKDVFKDFDLGDTWHLVGEGLFANGKQMASKNLMYTPRFQPGTLRVEMLLMSGFHDIVRIDVGHVHAKARWFGDGNLLMTYEPKYSKDVNDGPAWAKPQSFGGAYRYVVERTPESARFLLENKEFAKIPLSANAIKTEGPATIVLWSWADIFVQEFIVKGAVDPEWLKTKAKVDR
jgi:serine/threonine-protein kinase